MFGNKKSIRIFDLSKGTNIYSKLKKHDIMTTAIRNRQNKLETIISKIAGVNVELTVIDETFFSFAFDGDNETAANNIVNYFKSHANVENGGYDDECDCTVVYVRTK
jgi:hypothetical protein